MPGRRAMLLFSAPCPRRTVPVPRRPQLDWRPCSTRLASAHLGLHRARRSHAVLAYFVVKAWRWRYLIRHLRRQRRRSCCPRCSRASPATTCFPHAGEIARAVLASRAAECARERFPRLGRHRAYLRLPVHPRDRARSSWCRSAACRRRSGRRATSSARCARSCWRLSRCSCSGPRPACASRNACLRSLRQRLRTRVVTQLRAASTGLGAIATPRLFVPDRTAVGRPVDADRRLHRLQPARPWTLR